MSFQSTHPVWGATQRHFPSVALNHVISIHAPRVGCDFVSSRWTAPCTHHFNPRTPCGVRPLTIDQGDYFNIFQSTHPVWGATVWAARLLAAYRKFQSTHPVWGATSNTSMIGFKVGFQSTHPVWGATMTLIIDQLNSDISIHAPRVGCDICLYHKVSPLYRISIHAPRVGCDLPTTPQRATPAWYFNPRTPCGVRRP